jgi:N-acetylglucosaminyldiphosphoundecaprenol N-acetyl-beta-D-mannosaminyltransferase
VSSSAPRTTLASLPFDVVTTAEAAGRVVAAARAAVPSLVVTSNINHVTLAERDAAFRAVVEGAELHVADGWPLVAANRLLGGTRLPERVAGIDLVDGVLRSGERFRLAIVGGAPGAAAALARREESRHDVVLVDELPRGSWDTEEGRGRLAAAVAEARPTLTLIGIGAPRQELLAESLRGAVAGPILCCGAAIEVLAGLRPRAPRALQRVGLEWAFRAALEPRRLVPRYVRAGRAFAGLVARDLLGRRARRR